LRVAQQAAASGRRGTKAHWRRPLRWCQEPNNYRFKVPLDNLSFEREPALKAVIEKFPLPHRAHARGVNGPKELMYFLTSNILTAGDRRAATGVTRVT
jgi:hypothetical protein